jgi:dipeptidyl aminopeptidase/acylaminoacyl peptidase
MMVNASAGSTERPVARQENLSFEAGALARRVLNLDVTVHWIGDAGRFWLQRQRRGHADEFVIVDPAAASQSVVFDDDALRAALSAAGADERAVATRRVVGMTPSASGIAATVETAAGAYDCSSATLCCVARPSPPGAEIVMAPDGRRGVVRQGDDLYLRDVPSGMSRRLTVDGVANFGYGDLDAWDDVGRVTRTRRDAASPLRGVLWSPDGRYVVALRQDLRATPERLWVTEYVTPEPGDARVYRQRTGTARDRERPASRLTVIDTRTGVTNAVQLDPQALNDWARPYFTAGVVWWDRRARELYIITATRGGRRYGLVAIELATGRSREVLHEEAPLVMRLNQLDYSRPNVHVLSDAREAIWYSERSGQGHLYLYDVSSGAVKRQITRGDEPVFDLLRVDEAHRLVYFTAGTRGGSSPHERRLFRVGLDGGQPELLTPEPADHDFNNSFGAFGWTTPTGSRISPSGRYFVDVFSTVDDPPRVVVRRASGEFVMELPGSDPADLYASGWRPPEPFVAKAADGITDLYGVIFKPRDFDAGRRYPVIDVLYAGPQVLATPRAFGDSLRNYFERVPLLTDAGFVVVVLDGRGTPNRSRAFRDAFLRTEDVLGAADHVAVLRDLGRTRSYLDLDRVGVTGHSYGGYASLRAMLLFPDFFKVGVSSAGPAEWFTVAQSVSVERMLGDPSESSAARNFYDVASNTRLAPRLKGLLSSAFLTFDAFVKAGKDVDMLVLPDVAHGLLAHPYFVRRSVEYFREHLGDRGAVH